MFYAGLDLSRKRQLDDLVLDLDRGPMRAPLRPAGAGIEPGGASGPSQCPVSPIGSWAQIGSTP